jgi:hypothetical protein
MSKLPVDPYNRTYIVEAPLDNPDRAPLGGTGKDFVVTLSDNVETPGSDMMFLSRSGKWVPFTTTDLVTWGSITGDITEQADLMAMFAQYTPTTGYHSVAFSGNYNELNNLPPLGTVSPLNLNGATSMFLRGDGVWAIPVDVNAEWGNITGNINAQTDLIALLDLKAPITSPVFQGNPQAPTPPKDNNSKSIATTEWFFGQAFNGVPQMDGVGSSGNSTLWARGNHVHPTDTTKIGDAPNDGQQYARQSQTWTVVTGGGGGGGGVWIGDAPPSNPVTYPFWWSSTTLQLAIWYNDGNSSQWVDTNAQPSAVTAPWLLVDGTVAAPGLAFNSEPGLGMMRDGLNEIGFTAGGGPQQVRFTMLASGSSINVNPRAGPTNPAGLNLINAPVGTPSNYNIAGILCTPAGYTLITNAGDTPANQKPIQFNANGYNFMPPDPGGQTSVTIVAGATGGTGSIIYGSKSNPLNFRWLLCLGSSTAESGGNAGSDFLINRYADNATFLSTVMSISRATGQILFGSAVVSLTGGQLAFPATANPSADPNTLDDYKEGIWAPSNSAGIGFTLGYTYYTKVGRVVTIGAQITVAANASGAIATITGLPYFTSTGSIAVGYPGANIAGGVYAHCTGTNIQLYSSNGNMSWSQLSGTVIYIGGSYQNI